MALPQTRSYKLSSKQSILLNAVIFMFFTALGQVFDLVKTGFILGAILAVSLYFYQRMNRPGVINHYLKYIKVPSKLSGNKREEVNID